MLKELRVEELTIVVWAMAVLNVKPSLVGEGTGCWVSLGCCARVCNVQACLEKGVLVQVRLLSLKFEWAQRIMERVE